MKLFGKDTKDDITNELNNIAVVFDAINFNKELTPKKLEKVLSDIYINWDKQIYYNFLNRFQIPCDKKIESFSRGMTMKLSISVCLSHKANLLILDEATSSIDTRTERIVQEGMDALMEGRTTFVIAHRLSTIKNSDCIMVLEQGRIIERCSHDELMEQKGTYYRLQTGSSK